MNSKFLLAGILTFFICGSFIYFTISNHEDVKVEELCVDGNMAVNLEGFMCEREYVSFFGLDEENSGYLIPLLVLSLVFVFPLSPIMISIGITDDGMQNTRGKNNV